MWPRFLFCGVLPWAETPFFFFSHFYFPASAQAVVTGVVPSTPRFLPSICITHRVQQSHRSSIFHRVLLTHALAFSASQFVHKINSPRIYTSRQYALGGFELTKLTYTRLGDNLIRRRGDRVLNITGRVGFRLIQELFRISRFGSDDTMGYDG